MEDDYIARRKERRDRKRKAGSAASVRSEDIPGYQGERDTDELVRFITDDAAPRQTSAHRPITSPLPGPGTASQRRPSHMSPIELEATHPRIRKREMNKTSQSKGVLVTKNTFFVLEISDESSTDSEGEKHATVPTKNQIHVKTLSKQDKGNKVGAKTDRISKNCFTDENEGWIVNEGRRKRQNHVHIAKYEVLKSGPSENMQRVRQTDKTTKEAVKTNSQTTKMPQNNHIQHKVKKKNKKAPSSVSLKIYDELCKSEERCFFIITCTECTAQEHPRTNIQTHNECPKTKLMGRRQQDRVFTHIRERPFKYQAENGLCSFPVRSCPRGEKCDYPHSITEQLLWNCTDKYRTKVRNFQTDVDVLMLRHAMDQIVKKLFTLEQVCVKCLKNNDIAKFTKKPHKPLCGNEHSLSGGNLTVIVRREGDGVFCAVGIELDNPGIDEPLRDMAERIKSLRQSGYTIEEIVSQYKAIKQRGSIKKEENDKRTNDTNRSFENRRSDFKFMPSQTEKPRRDIIYDTEFGDLMPEEDVDSEEELSDDDFSGEGLEGEEQLRYSLTPIQECERLLQEKPETYKRCTIHLDGSQDATCKPLDQSETNIKIHGRHNCGTAFDGDEVIVEIKLWMDVETKKTQRGGRVRCVTKHCTNREAYVFVCVVDEFASNLMIPLCGKAPKLHIYDKEVKSHNRNDINYNDQRITICEKRQSGSITPLKGRETSISPKTKYNSLFVVKYVKWEARRTYPFGYVTKVIRGGDNLKRGSLVLKLKYQVPMISSVVPQDLDYDSIIFDAKTEENRKDLIDLKVFSIDPDSCRDVDDALSLEYIRSCHQQGKYKVGIHISDVTALVAMDSHVDKAASKRRTSYYPLTDTVHMLPEYLATNFCSLIEGKHRLAMSFFFMLDKTGRIVEKPTVCESVICNRKQFTYTEANSIILGSDNTDDSFSTELKMLFSLALKLRTIRKRLPAVNSDEDCAIKFPPSEEADDSCHAHVLVEEFMILVNTFAAELMYAYRPDRGILHKRLSKINNTAVSHESSKPTCIVRCQRQPLKEDLEVFKDTFGCGIDSFLFLRPYYPVLDRRDQSRNLGSGKISIIRSTLDDIRSAVARGDTAKILELLCRPETSPRALVAQREWFAIQSPAQVVVPETTDCGHFSLQRPFYTWFTSPIRRYIDIVNHRILKAVIRRSKRLPYLRNDLESICHKFNKTHQRQKLFSEGLRRLKACEFLKEMPFFIPCSVRATDEDAIQCVIPFFPHCKTSDTKIQYGKLILSRRPKQIEVGKMLWFERRIYDMNKHEISCLRSKGENTSRDLQPKWHIFDLKQSDWSHLINSSCLQQITVLNTQNDDNGKKGILVYCRIITDDVKADESVKKKYTRVARYFPKAKVFQDKKSQRIKKRHKGDREHIAPHMVQVVDLGKIEESSNIEVTSEMKGSVPIVNHQAPFKVHWCPNDVLQLQICASYKEGLLGASINGITLTENLHHCYQHNNDPISCFAEVAERKSKSRYKDVRDYQETWLPIINMNAITNTVQDASPIIVRGVNITLTQHNKDFYGSMQFEKRFLKQRQIHFIPHDSAAEDEDDLQDYLCLQIPMQKSGEFLPKGNNKIRPYFNWTNRWVAHALIINVTDANKSEREPEKTEITLKQKTDATKNAFLRVDFKLHHFSAKMTKMLLNESGSETHTGNIEFMSKTLPDRRMFNAVFNLEQATEFSTEIVLGTVLDNKITMSNEWLDAIPKSLDIDVQNAVDKQRRTMQLYPNNNMQKKAIYEGLRRRFTVIQGPPGTGKTLTGVKLLYWFVQLNRHMEAQDGVRRQVMYCGPSNSAVDVATRLLKYRLAEKCPKLVRVFSENIHKQDFPIPREYTRSNKKNKYDGLSRTEMEDLALHFLIRNERNQRQMAAKIKEFDHRFKTVKPELIQQAEIDEYNDIVKKACIDELAKYDIILCSCSVSGGPRILRGCSITQCVIDECGMCMEPETLVPLTALSPQPQQIVLIGDHKQLRPIVKNPTASRLGLDKSLFERYASMRAGLIMLDEQYRMNEKICEFPSNQFYGGKLKTHLTDYWRSTGALPERVWPNKAPFVFCHVEGLEETQLIASTEGNEQSKWNQADAFHAIRIFLAFTGDLKVDYKRIVILSQYKAQVKYIEKQLIEIHHYTHPNVSTVVSSQGDEWDYVILSTVRSLPQYQIDTKPSPGWLKHNLGFIIDHNQINVALTRARKGLVIIGNQHLLRCDNNSKNGLWGKLLEFYDKNGCIVDANKFPRTKEGYESKKFWSTHYRPMDRKGRVGKIIDNPDNAVMAPRFREAMKKDY